MKDPVNGLARYMGFQLLADFRSDFCHALDKKDNILHGFIDGLFAVLGPDIEIGFL